MEPLILFKDQVHEIEKLSDHVYRIDEAGLANAYLVIGSKRALLIDTAVGAGNIKECAASLTDKPIEVVVTHRHNDHVGGAWQFGSYYASKDDKTLACHISSLQILAERWIRKNGIKLSLRKPLWKRTKVCYIDEQKIFDLGDRQIKVVSVAGHTKGSIILVDDVDKIVYTGDAFNPHLFMQIPGCTLLNEWFTGADKVLGYLEQGYTAYFGHDKGKQTIEQIKKTYDLVSELIELKHKGLIEKQKGIYPPGDILPRIYYDQRYIK